MNIDNFDIKLTIIPNHKEDNLRITHRFKCFKSEIYGLNKKIKNASKYGSKYKEILKITMKNDSNLSHKNIC